MGDKKRSRLEKKAKKILKKLRRAEEPVEETPETSNPPKKVYGPPRPPREVLESRPIIGPEIPEAYKKEDEDIEEVEVIGPALPEDDPSVEIADRNEAVDEILLILEESQSDYVDPYAVLGISEEDATDASVKKAYWKKSLAVHPDKTSHPQAPKVDQPPAFQALNQAWKDLQSSERRQAARSKRKDADVKKQVEIEVRKQRRQREWDSVLNPGRQKEEGRQAWMTELPELRRAPREMKQINQTRFSRKGFVDLSTVDTSGWTNSTPAVKKLPVVDRSDSPGKSGRARWQGEERPSLLEQHLASLKKTGKQKSEKPKGFVYRPFDRERDLQSVAREDIDIESMAAGLKSRFR